MTNRMTVLAVATVFTASMMPFAKVASAMPIADALAIKNAASTNIETVQFRRGWGWGVGAGFLGGAIVGGLLANPYYYGPGPYYSPAPAYIGPPPGNAVAYCIQRFQSYDPGSGTYLGYDGPSSLPVSGWTWEGRLHAPPQSNQRASNPAAAGGVDAAEEGGHRVTNQMA